MKLDDVVDILVEDINKGIDKAYYRIDHQDLHDFTLKIPDVMLANFVVKLEEILIMGDYNEKDINHIKREAIRPINEMINKVKKEKRLTKKEQYDSFYQ
jgi:hypothetical protein